MQAAPGDQCSLSSPGAPSDHELLTRPHSLARAGLVCGVRALESWDVPGRGSPPAARKQEPPRLLRGGSRAAGLEMSPLTEPTGKSEQEVADQAQEPRDHLCWVLPGGILPKPPLRCSEPAEAWVLQGEAGRWRTGPSLPAWAGSTCW